MKLLYRTKYIKLEESAFKKNCQTVMCTNYADFRSIFIKITLLLTFVVAFKGTKNHYKERGRILSGIHQVWKSLPRIVVPPQTLSETDPGRNTIHHRPYSEVLLHARTGVCKTLFTQISTVSCQFGRTSSL